MTTEAAINPTPNFFVLGAPKCGTSAIAAWLAAHPDVFMAPAKEPHHFNTDMAHRNYIDRAEYERLFRGAEGHAAVGEASVWYLLSQAAVPNIEAYAGEPRYIVCLRNPVEMAYSLHEQQVFSGNEDELDFERAWEAAEDRRQGRRIPAAATDPTTLIYPDACALGGQLERLYRHVERERVHVVVMEDLRNDARAVFEGVQHFLGVPADPSIELTVVNAAKARKSHTLQRLTGGLGRLKAALRIKARLGLLKRLDESNRTARTRPPMDEALRNRLAEYFEPEVELLHRLTGRDLRTARR